MERTRHQLESSASSGFGLIAALYFVIAVAMVWADTQTTSLRALRSVLASGLNPVIMFGDHAKQQIEKINEVLRDNTHQYTRNQKLVEENGLLRLQLQRLSTLSDENQRLRQLLELKDSLKHRALLAEISSVSREPFTHKVVINRGRLDKVYPGQAVMDGQGVFGQVDQVTETTSSVIMITDSNHALPVQVLRTGLRTLVYGSGVTSSILVPYLSNQADVVTGDRLITSGLGGRFPYGYSVGVITSVMGDSNSPFLKVEAEPAAELESGKTLLLIWTGLAVP